MAAVFYVAIVPTSSCIGRWAPVAPALIYVFVAFSALFKRYGVVGLDFAITVFATGLALLPPSTFQPVQT